jgi:hypothetical protein
MLVACSGLSTTARLTAGPKPWIDYGASFPDCNSFTRRLNQVGIYFSIVQSKVLTPNDFPDLDAVVERLLDFQYYWEATAQPFEWKFTRDDLKELLDKLEQHDTAMAAGSHP